MKYIIILLAVLSIFLVGCTVEEADTTTTPNDSKLTTVIIEEDMVESTRAVKEFDIIARNWDFEPNVIEVNQGDLVRLTVTNVDVDHGLSIPEFGINEEIPAGKTVTVEFTADKVGEFRFFCNVYCGAGHRDMEGVIIVK